MERHHYADSSADLDYRPEQPLDVVEVYDPKLDTWTTGLARMPVPLGYLGASGAPVSGGIIYVLAPNTMAFGYNPATNSWTTFNSMPGSAWGVTAINGSLYAIGPEHTIQGVQAQYRVYLPIVVGTRQ